MTKNIKKSITQKQRMNYLVQTTNITRLWISCPEMHQFTES